jgi:hypothetical protein
MNQPGENKNNGLRLWREQEHRYRENKDENKDNELVWLDANDAHWDQFGAHHSRRALEESKNNRVDSDECDFSDTMLLPIPIPILLDDDVASDSDFSDTMPELASDDDEYVDITRVTVGHTHHQVDRMFGIDTRGDTRDTRGG